MYDYASRKIVMAPMAAACCCFAGILFLLATVLLQATVVRAANATDKVLKVQLPRPQPTEPATGELTQHLPALLL